MEKIDSLPSEITSVLGRVRRRLRLWSMLDGMALFAMLLTGLLWIAFFWDYLTEPSRGIRIGFLPLLGITTAVLGFWHLIRRLFVRLTDRSMALVLERKYPELLDRLVTAVELPRQADGYSARMLQKTTRDVVNLVDTLDLRGIIRYRPVLLRGLLGTLAVATLIIFALARPVVATTWLRRTLLFDSIRYPRYTQLQIVGFEDQAKKVARGRDFELAVTADPNMIVPEKVEVRYRMSKSGTKGNQYLTKIGANRFRFVFKNVLEPIELEVRGGDDRTEMHELIVVEPPGLEKVLVRATFPEYTGQANQEIRFAGTPIALVRGTKIDVDLVANKPIRRLQALKEKDELKTKRNSANSFQISTALDGDLPLSIVLLDEDGIEGSEPFRIDFQAALDQAPTIEAALRGVSSAVTPVANIPIEAKVIDDYGIRELSFEHKVDAEAPLNMPIVLPDKQRSIEETMAFDVSKLQLKPGQRLTLAIVAEDGDTLEGPHAGRSIEFPFEIVTPAELLSRLAIRELNLRQRFEQTLRELTESRAHLGELETAVQGSATPLAEKPHEGTLDPNGIVVERQLQELRKGANEVVGIHDAFRDILDELVNNRAGSSTLLERIDSSIVQPLSGLITKEIPDADHRLEELRSALGSATAGTALLAALDAEDRLLTRAHEILQGMLKLETFNEALAMLRGIITEQQGLLEKTKEQRKKQVLELLK